MAETNINVHKATNIVLGIAFALVIIVSISAIYYIDDKSNEIKAAYNSSRDALHDKADQLAEKNKQVDALVALNKKIIADSIDAGRKIEKLEAKNKELVAKLEKLKTKDDMAQRDLEAYILKKYRTIPEIVAKEVAYQVVKRTKLAAVPFPIIVGLIEVESRFMPWAISKKGARGLMQVMPAWITNKKANLGIESKYDLHDIGTNVAAGIKVFKIHLKEANNDINRGLYLYVGKDKTYANKVFNAMGRFEIFRSTLDTALRDEENQDTIKETPERGEETPDAEKKVILKGGDLPKTFDHIHLPITLDTYEKKKTSLKYRTFNKEAYARANEEKGHDMGILGPHAKLFRS